MRVKLTPNNLVCYIGRLKIFSKDSFISAKFYQAGWDCELAVVRITCRMVGWCIYENWWDTISPIPAKRWVTDSLSEIS